MSDTRYETGSALILAVVLTSLLAIVGVMFLMVARVDRIATSAISENRELNFAVETVIAKISQELVLDVPGVAGQPDYHDYPGPEDKWLASLEPYDADPNLLVVDPCWQQISDIYEVPGSGVGLLEWFGVTGWVELDSGDLVEPRNLRAQIISPADPVGGAEDLTAAHLPVDFGGPADADGDGVADSRWIKLPNMSSSKGKPIFAAIRIVDNGGMLNVNTAYKFDPYDPCAAHIDGSSQLQINLAALARGTPKEDIDVLHATRVGPEDPWNFDKFQNECIWMTENPNGQYLPFDISDELILRNRYMVDQNDTITRLKAVWPKTFDRGGGYSRSVPCDQSSDLGPWFNKVSADGVPQWYYPPHIATTYNMDRIINPLGQFLNQGKMVNVNRINPIAEPNIADLYNAIWTGLYDAGVLDPNSLAAQMAVNIVDYRDADSDVTVYNGYYGFERPCIYISELAHNFVPADPCIPGDLNHMSYAIELYKPYFEDNDPCAWQLVIDGSPIIIDSWTGGNQFYVIRNEDPCALLPSVDAVTKDSNALIFNSNSNIFLQRPVGVDYITVDMVTVPEANKTSGWLQPDANSHSIERDITPHKCIRRLWADAFEAASPTLGNLNNYPPDPDPDPNMIQAHPYLDPNIYQNKGFKNIGEIGMVFHKSAYLESVDVIGPSDTEATARINLADPIFQQIFNYLTVFDPSSDLINNDGDYVGALENIDENNLDETPEWKIPGRININTAPWYVIAQLPWVSYHTPNFDLARAIVDYRDNTAGGFGSIGELNRVGIGDPNNYRSMGFYALDPNDLQGFPDLTPNDGDGALGNFEERDVIFARISNLVTVRSDVFTAYILVRIGVDGPQKRVIVILDRSNVYSSDGKVRIVALHPVPDPR